jgi:perosamine synthetase
LVSYGPFVNSFEDEIKHRLRRDYAIGVSSGTAALHLALIAVGVRGDDEVPVSALSFIAPANAIRYVGAWPVFIDAEPAYRQMDPEKLEAWLGDACERRDDGVYNTATGRRVGAILAVDVLGHPADLDAIERIADVYDLPLVEDAAEALGARLRNVPAGAFGKVSCLSFNGNKIITAASGGMVVTNDERVAERVRYLSQQAKDDELEYIHGEIGFNYRLSNLHAALGYGQLHRLDEFIREKRRIAEGYAIGLKGVRGVELPSEAPWAFSTYWLYTIHIDQEQYGIGSRDLMHALIDAHIHVRPLWQPLQRSPAHASAGSFNCEIADNLCATGLSLPCSVALTRSDQERVIEMIQARASCVD